MNDTASRFLSIYKKKYSWIKTAQVEESPPVLIVYVKYGCALLANSVLPWRWESVAVIAKQTDDYSDCIAPAKV